MSDNTRQHLETLIQLHQSNLQRLEIQAAGHGTIDIPLHLGNQIDAEKQEILRLQSQLSALKGPGNSLIASPQSHGQQPIASFSSPPVIPEELQYSFADRFAYISASQRSLLMFIEQKLKQTPFVTQDALEEHLSRRDKSEIYYRIEQLYLLGFLDRQLHEYTTSGVPRYRYSLSAAYQAERSNRGV